jgi:hypothetical protein
MSSFSARSSTTRVVQRAEETGVGRAYARAVMRTRAAVIACLAVSCSLAVAVPAGARTRAEGSLPPSDQGALQRMFDPQLAPLGLHTTRAALQDAHDYRRSAKGTHLAMYVEPTSAGLVDRAIYVRNIMRVARIFLPSIYRRWPGLQSFDICQEPEQVLDPRPAPIPVTQLVASRQAAAAVDWKHATLATLLRRVKAVAGKKGAKNDLSLYVSPRTLAEPSYQAALTAAGVTRESTSTRPRDEG